MRRSFVFVTLLMMFSLPVFAQVAVPPMINFQGRLAKPDGTPVLDTTTQILTFRLFDALSNGNHLWLQISKNVAVHNGTFAVQLDFSKGFEGGNTLLTAFANFKFTPYLEIRVGSDPPLTPRQKLTANSYAFLASEALTVLDGSITPPKLAFDARSLAQVSGNLLSADASFLALNDHTLHLRSLSDGNHGLGYFSTFGGDTLDGPALFGFSGGTLGTVSGTTQNRVLTWTNGGAVGIGTVNPNALLDVNGDVRADTLALNDPANTGNVQLTGYAYQAPNQTDQSDLIGLPHIFSLHTTSVWQSFTAGVTANLTGLTLTVYVLATGHSSASTTLNFYSGEGTGGTLLASKTVTVTGNRGEALDVNVTFTLPNIPVVAGQQYTFSLGAFSGGITVKPAELNTNPYAGGHASTGANDDLLFATSFDPNISLYGLDVNGPVRSNGSLLNSDARYKTNIATFDNALDAILNLHGVTFDWKRDAWKEKNFPDGRQIGFIAQEVEQVLPELVSTDAKGYKSVAYSNIVPVLVEAIKTLKRDNDLKDAELKRHNVEVLELRKRLDALTLMVDRLVAGN